MATVGVKGLSFPAAETKRRVQINDEVRGCVPTTLTPPLTHLISGHGGLAYTIVVVCRETHA